MASVIDKVTVKAGRLIRVDNTNRPKFSNSAKMYAAVWVEDPNGKNERCWLLTKNEIERLDYRASRNKEDLTKKSKLTDMLD